MAGTAVTTKDVREEHERLFQAGNTYMRRGEYKSAVTAFTQATAAAPGGMGNRKGGQYAIYLAQALQAAGRKKEAVGLLKRCESHPDADDFPRDHVGELQGDDLRAPGWAPSSVAGRGVHGEEID